MKTQKAIIVNAHATDPLEILVKNYDVIQKMPHLIGLGSLVEVADYGNPHDHTIGLRFYVQGHYHNEKGDPVYNLTTNIELVGREIIPLDRAIQKDEMATYRLGVDHGACYLGYPEGALIIIKAANKKVIPS